MRPSAWPRKKVCSMSEERRFYGRKPGGRRYADRGGRFEDRRPFEDRDGRFDDRRPFEDRDGRFDDRDSGFDDRKPFEDRDEKFGGRRSFGGRNSRFDDRGGRFGDRDGRFGGRDEFASADRMESGDDCDAPRDDFDGMERRTPRREFYGERQHVESILDLEAASVEEALSVASKTWGVPESELRADVKGSERGFLGIFGSKLRVEVRPVKPLLLLKSLRFTNDILKLMDVEAEAAFDDEDTIVISGNDAELVVGRRGDSLKSLEYLVNLALRDPSESPRVRLDSNGYRERRTRSLERLAEAAARQVEDYGQPIRLDPMLSWERWVIHTFLKNREGIRTESVGEPPFRKVVIMPTYNPDSDRRSFRPRRPYRPQRRKY